MASMGVSFVVPRMILMALFAPSRALAGWAVAGLSDLDHKQ